jgi:hypothetical protein
MADMGRRKPSPDEPLHSLPLHAPFLTSPFKSAMPEVADREAEVGQSVPVSRHSEVSDMPAHNGLQPLADFRNRIMHTPPQLDLDAQQRGLHAGCGCPILNVRRGGRLGWEGTMFVFPQTKTPGRCLGLGKLIDPQRLGAPGHPSRRTAADETWENTSLKQSLRPCTKKPCHVTCVPA